MKRVPRTRSSESGYAMLMVFAMAAAIAVSLYIELPRVAFEAQREQEQVLVDRGEQYMRAIKLYHRRFKTFPPTLEALENTNNVRFLRRRYTDPMTGKDEWRLIRGMPNGTLVDSLVQKPPKLGQDPTKKDDKDQTASSTGTGSGGEGEGEHKETRANLRRRPSEQGGDPNYLPMPGQTFDQNQQNQDTQQAGNAPNAFPSGTDPQQQQGQPGQPNPDGTVPPGQPQPGQPQPSQPQPGQPATSGLGSPYSVQPGQSPYPPMNPGNFGPRPGGPAPGAQTPSNPGGQGPGQGNNEAMQMISKILTSPRPGGLSGIQTSGPNLSGGAIGIAGVATKFEGEGIKVYNERSKYQEWEFVYDLKKDPMLAGQALGGVSGLPGQGQGQGGMGTQQGHGQTRTTKPGK